MASRRAPRSSNKREVTPEERRPREVDTRDHGLSPQDNTYLPPSALPEPTPRDGWKFRYIRSAMLNQPDTRNVSTAFREGWRPCLLSEHPELKIVETDKGSKWAEDGYVEIGGLVLCKMPQERADSRDDYYRRVTSMQMQSVDENMMQEERAKMPILRPDRQTTTRTGPGAKNE